eukprot:6199150-Pleurochrysis_carterae.AAC.1
MSGRQNKSGFAAVNRKQTSASSSEADELTDAINELRRLKDTHDAACADSAAKACASVSQLQAAEERRASAQEQHFVPLLVKLKSIKATLKAMNRRALLHTKRHYCADGFMAHEHACEGCGGSPCISVLK